jgi:hypothetical protein
MMTRREVLTELNRMGVRKLSLLKTYSRDFEKYIGTYYDFQVLRTKKKILRIRIVDFGLRNAERKTEFLI